MPLSPGYSDFVVDLLDGFGAVEIKKMFGGAGVYRGGVMFALLDDDTIFLKADPAFAAELKASGSKPWVFSVMKDGSVRPLGYWSIPDSALDDPAEAADLARRALAAAGLASKSSSRRTPAASGETRKTSTSRKKPAAKK